MATIPAKPMSLLVPVAPRVSAMDTIGVKAATPSATRFEAARRLDWRFLLPEPNLGSVLYYGPAHAPLVEALRAFSRQVTLFDPAHQRGPLTAHFDLIVARTPNFEALQNIFQLLRPGGNLYIEAIRAWGFRRRSSPSGHTVRKSGRVLRSARNYAAACRELGFAEVVPHWHWPDLENCLEIVPLEDSAAIDCALARRNRSWTAQVRRALVEQLVRRGLWAHFAPAFSVVASRPKHGLNPPAILYADHVA